MGLLLLQGSAALNPRELFSNNEQGLWLDPSQMSTLYQDSNGVTPCTAAGDPVGLILDQSRGGLSQIGAELWTNPTPTINNNAGSNGVYNAGTLTMTNSGSAALAYPRFSFNLGLTAGKFYRVTGLVTGNISKLSNFRLATNGTANNVGYSTTTGLISSITNAGAGGSIEFVTDLTGAESITISSLSIREVPGNHAYQTTSASRPTLARIPSSGRRNLLTRTEEFDNAAWTKTNSTMTAGVLDPNGGSTAWTLTATGASGLVRQSISGLSGSLSNSIWIRRRTGTGVVRFYTGAASLTQQMQSVITSDWQRLSTTPGTATGTGDQFGVICETSGDAVDIWHPQLETGSTATNYQKVVATTDVTESGVSDLWHLIFDGSDDSLTTNSVDMTGTAQMTVIAGVRKLSDAATAMLVELSATASSNAGSFYITAPGASGATPYESLARGDAALNANQQSSVTGVGSAPDSCVLSTTHDISADLTTFRRNGTDRTNATGDKGAGNFGNYAVYIGRRGGASFPFNGHLYQLIIRGKTTPTGKLLEAERFVGRKTGVSF